MSAEPKLKSIDTCTPNLLPEILRFRPRRRSRTDKIARLPKPLRDSINEMLDEGLPYKEIIQRLGDHGKHLNKQNISRWKQGPYQEYLKGQDFNEFTRHQMEFAAELLPEMPENSRQLQEACNRIAALQVFNALLRQGAALVTNTLQLQPENFYKLANTIYKISSAELDLAKHRRMLRKAELRETLAPSGPFPLDPVALLTTKRPLLPAQVTPSHG